MIDKQWLRESSTMLEKREWTAVVFCACVCVCVCVCEREREREREREFHNSADRLLLLFNCEVVCNSFCGPMGSSLPSFSIHGVSQARILQWVAISFSRGSSRWTQGLNLGLLHCQEDSLSLSHLGSPLADRAWSQKP